MSKAKPRIVRRFDAWAIQKATDLGPTLLGKYYFGHQPLPEHDGGVIALFSTRAAARAHLQMLYLSHEAVVRRVAVTIEAEEGR